MSDLIDKQALCDYLREYKVHPISVSSDEFEVKGYNNGIDLAISVISEFSSAKSEQKWIPITERLPKTNGCYLVWRPHFFGGKIGMPAICYFDGQNTWHDAYGVDFSRVLHEKDITAWMPLPESYRGE